MNNSISPKADIALIGLGVMGANLALNMARHGLTVAVFNRTPEKTLSFMQNGGNEENFIPCHNIKDMVTCLKKPGIIMLMVKAGSPVDGMINQLTPLLEPGDIIIDGGNSHYSDTGRRVNDLAQHGIYYAGCGISGGAGGALNGPSIMPGGNPAAWPFIKPLLQKIAAQDADGMPCCRWIGGGGAGHFVKMVHNGIEYAVMQLISEAVMLLRKAGFSPDECAGIFRRWNQGELQSYLTEITAAILEARDRETGLPMLDVISDRAGQKGTGAWTVHAALDMGMAMPSAAEALFARFISCDTALRQSMQSLYPAQNRPFKGGRMEFAGHVRQALYAAEICAYAQGFELMRQASVRYGWQLEMPETALIWRAGCIIRAGLLDIVSAAFRSNEFLLQDGHIRRIITGCEPSWRHIASEAVAMALPVPGIISALNWFDSVRSAELPTVLVQAQRDYFGSHTFERKDRDNGIFFHNEWL